MKTASTKTDAPRRGSERVTPAMRDVMNRCSAVSALARVQGRDPFEAFCAIRRGEGSEYALDGKPLLRPGMFESAFGIRTLGVR